MQECTTASADGASLPPNKRLNYPFGMIMGVDDFLQEQVHTHWQDRLGNLLLHGYGTVCGLQVTKKLVGTGPEIEIQVAPGYACSPQGDWIWVEKALCAYLHQWLIANDGIPTASSPPVKRPVYVNLCYTECPTDLVPIAESPCASADETRAPSRILETATASFSWERPPQPLEEATRRFGQLLERIKIASGILSPDDSAAFMEEVRHLDTPPPLTSPPVPPDTIQLSEDTACDTIRDGLAAWLTEVCPRLRDQEATKDKNGKQNQCILLACIDYEIDALGNLDFDKVLLDNCVRPFLVSTRLQQELFCLAVRGGKGEKGDPGTNGTNGSNGTNGTDGEDGSKWHTGSGDPNSNPPPDPANVGDYYLDTTSGDYYKKTGATWTQEGNLKGPTGQTGADGSKWQSDSGPPTSATGGAIGDYYLDTSSGPGKGNVYRKTAPPSGMPPEWDGPIVNLTGPAGVGSQGPAGPGLKQVIINPNMMMMMPAPPSETKQVTATLVLTASIAPAWNIPSGQSVVFSWGWPDTIQPTSDLKLQLVWATEHVPSTAIWAVLWRWVSAATCGKNASQANSLNQDLVKAVPDSIPCSTSVARVRLDPKAPVDPKAPIAPSPPFVYKTDPFTLSNPDIPVGDLLIVRIMLAATEGTIKSADLLLAELTWTEGT